MRNKNLFALTIALAASLITACASQPAAPTADAAPATSQPTSKASEADTASAMEKRFQEVARSYKTVKRDGKILYCKREKMIGSTIPTMQCYTETQLRNQIEATEELKKRMRRGGGPCVQTGGCAGG